MFCNSPAIDTFGELLVVLGELLILLAELTGSVVERLLDLCAASLVVFWFIYTFPEREDCNSLLC